MAEDGMGTYLDRITATIVGKMYSSPPVVSNMITTSETVMRVTPPITEAAPMMA